MKLKDKPHAQHFGLIMKLYFGILISDLGSTSIFISLSLKPNFNARFKKLLISYEANYKIAKV